MKKIKRVKVIIRKTELWNREAGKIWLMNVPEKEDKLDKKPQYFYKMTEKMLKKHLLQAC